MPASTFQAPHNSSVLADFLSFGTQMTAALNITGLVRTTDTGQVEFTTIVVTIVNTQLTSNIATYTCADTTGLRVGQSITVAGLTNNAAVYNRTGVITALTSNSFSLAVTNANIAATNDAGTGTVAAIAAVPARGTAVYQIWRFADTLQSTAPVYLKIYYGNYNNNYVTVILGPLFLVGIGTGSNGAGGLYNEYISGNPSWGYSADSNNNVTATTTYTDCYVSGDINRLSLLLWRTSAYPHLFSVERAKESNGDDSPIGVCSTWTFTINTSGSTKTLFKGFDFMKRGGTHYSDSTAIPCIQFGNTTTLMSQTISVFPLFSPFGGIQNPLVCCLSGKYGDFGELDQFSYAVYPNKLVNYLVSSVSTTGNAQRNFGYGTSNAFIMRYD